MLGKYAKKIGAVSFVTGWQRFKNLLGQQKARQYF